MERGRLAREPRTPQRRAAFREGGWTRAKPVRWLATNGRQLAGETPALHRNARLLFCGPMSEAPALFPLSRVRTSGETFRRSCPPAPIAPIAPCLALSPPATMPPNANERTLFPMTCLVTGGAGFLGAHVARDLVARGRDVVVLDDLSGGFRENVPDGARFVEGSILDEPLVDRLFGEHRFRHVYHLAAYAAEGLSHFIRRFNYHNNLIGSVHLINASVRHEVECFVFTSSIAVYGAAEPPMTEDTPPRPEDPYGIAKLAVEQDLQAAHRLFSLPYVIFRPHNVYGEGQNLADPYRNVIGIFLRQMMEGRPLTIFGDGEQTRAFSYVREVAPLIAQAPDTAAARNQMLNIGADEQVSLNALAALLGEVWGRPVDIRRLAERQEVKHAWASHERLRAVFPAPSRRWTLREGLENMAAWARGRALPPPRRFENIEIHRGLPEGWD